MVKSIRRNALRLLTPSQVALFFMRNCVGKRIAHPTRLGAARSDRDFYKLESEPMLTHRSSFPDFIDALVHEPPHIAFLSPVHGMLHLLFYCPAFTMLVEPVVATKALGSILSSSVLISLVCTSSDTRTRGHRIGCFNGIFLRRDLCVLVAPYVFYISMYHACLQVLG